MHNFSKKLIYTFLFLLLLMPVLEFGSKVLLDLKNYISIKINSHQKISSIPTEFTLMELGQFPITLTHLDFNSNNYNSINGFRGNQSDYEIKLTNDLQYDLVGSRYNITAFLGGSTTFGIGATDDFTTAELFNKKFPEKNVINLGLGSADQEDEIMLLNYFLKKGYQFEEVIFLDGINEDDCFFRNAKNINDGLKSNNQSSRSNYYISQFWFDYVGNKIKKLIKKHNLKEKKLIENEKIDYCSKKFLDNLIYLEKMSEAFDFKVIVFLQPTIETVTGRKSKKKYDLFYDSILDKVNEGIYNFNEVKLLDIRKAVDENHFLDAQHLSNEGNLKLSESIVSEYVSLNSSN